jgi:hypothetical protein
MYFVGIRRCILFFYFFNERIFTKLKHPNETQRCEIVKELGLEPRQLKFWFQNKNILLRVNFFG